MLTNKSKSGLYVILTSLGYVSYCLQSRNGTLIPRLFISSVIILIFGFLFFNYMRSKNSKWTQVRYWDWKSIISILLIVISFILFFFLRANTSHFALMYSQRNMDGNINGAIIERNALTGMSQTVTGNRSKVEGITVTYTYNINSVQYHQKQYLTYSFIDRKKLDYISSSKLPILISIKFDTSHPYISSISLDN